MRPRSRRPLRERILPPRGGPLPPPCLLAPAAVCLLALALLAGSAAAHEVVTKDGTRYEGRVVSAPSDEEVVIETTFGGTKRIPRADVAEVDRTVPPLRDQLAYRRRHAEGDRAKLWSLHRWAAKQGFEDELESILFAIVEAAPDDRRARKALGHEKVDGEWMTPGEIEVREREKHAEAMRAKGLVLHEGRWVTPEEKEALDKGLIEDGDEWVTEEEYHRRRGEQLVDGQWIRVGEEEGKAWAEAAKRGARRPITYHWSPHFDLVGDVEADLAERILKAAEDAYAAMRRVLRPDQDEYPETLEERIKIAAFHKATAYASFTRWFNEQEKCDDIQPGWSAMVVRQPGFWWTHPTVLVAGYQFPETARTFVSNVLHNVGLVLLTRYKLNFRYPSVWLREGFAYWLELETIGYSTAFTLGRGGTSVQGGGVEGPSWRDSDTWKAALRQLVADGRDPPVKRMAAMDMNGFGYVELVKSWSVVDYLVRKDAEAFRAFIARSKHREGNGDPIDEEVALQEAYGLSYRELDAAWRAWAQGGFGKP